MEHQQNKGRVQTFGRDLMKFLQQGIPQGIQQDLKQTARQYNPKFEYFHKKGPRAEQAVSRHSVSRTFVTSDQTNSPLGNTAANTNYLQYLYANVDTDKTSRIVDYRIMAAYSELADALDEICDDFLYGDENNNVIKVEFRNEELDKNTKMELRKEFNKVAEYFDLENKGWSYVRKLLIEGELFFEHVIHEDYLNEGILGIVEMPTDLVDPIYDNVQNMEIKAYLLRKPVFDPKTNTVEKYEFIPMERNQVTYVHSDEWNEDQTMKVPFIERARRAYRQLTVVEDSIVIYRLVRAPEKLVFDVDVGTMSPPKAEAYLRKLMHNYFSKKTFDNQQGGKVNAFNPQAQLDSFWFARRQGSEGTKVTQLAGGANLGELTDLMYFVKKLYKSLKVPANRLDQESSYKDATEILREELKFAKFIIRLQKLFARQLKHTFITHLKLRGLWKQFKLHERDFEIVFVPPSSFYTLREQQIFDLKANNFNTMTSNEGISNIYAQKKYLGWTDEEILQNRECLRKDKEIVWEMQQIEADGPGWADGPAGGEGGDGLGDGGGGIPSFGGGGEPFDIGGGEEIPGAQEAQPGDVAGGSGQPQPAPTNTNTDTALPQ